MTLIRLLATVVALAALTACGARSSQPRTAGPEGRPLAMAAIDVEPDDVYVRVVDSGPALCAVVTIPGGHSMVYDAGHWNGRHCIRVVRELIPGPTIDLMVLSHSDADHLGDAARILNEKRVRQTILAGEVRTTGTFKDFMAALGKEVQEDGGSVQNLQSVDLAPGTVITLGDAR